MPVTPFFSVNGTYDSNLLLAGVDENGKFTARGSAGVETMFGANGQRRMRRSLLGLDYQGNYAHYQRATFFNGSNHQIGLSYADRLSKRWMFDTKMVGGTSNRAIGSPAIFAGQEVEFLNVPADELFDSRYYYLQNQTSATYFLTNRQSFRFGGNGGTVRRRARFLVDANLYGATGDWAYRLNRRTTIGVAYGFSHFDFTKVFGETDMQQVGVVFGRQFGRDWEITLGGTGFKQSTVGIREVSLDPVLQALLGRAVGREVFESNNLLGGYSAALRRSLRRTMVSLRADRGITPGNGYFLTSRTDTVGLDVGHAATRKWNVNGSIGYAKMKSLGFVSDPYRGWTGGAGVNYRISENLAANVRADWRTFEMGDTLKRTGGRVTIGLSYLPSGNLRLW